MHDHSNTGNKDRIWSIQYTCKLPPSSSAVKYHCLRTYHQVQEWLFNECDPVQYGWVLNSDNEYGPVYPDKDVTPASIFNEVKCGCNSNCSSRKCGCKRLEFQCSIYCECGDECENRHTVRFDDDDGDDGQHDVDLPDDED